MKWHRPYEKFLKRIRPFGKSPFDLPPAINTSAAISRPRNGRIAKISGERKNPPPTWRIAYRSRAPSSRGSTPRSWRRARPGCPTPRKGRTPTGLSPLSRCCCPTSGPCASDRPGQLKVRQGSTCGSAVAPLHLRQLNLLLAIGNLKRPFSSFALWSL